MTMTHTFLVGLCVVLWLSAGCANTKTATGAMAHGAIEAVCTVAHKGVDLAFGPVNDLQANATTVVGALTTPAK